MLYHAGSDYCAMNRWAILDVPGLDAGSVGRAVSRCGIDAVPLSLDDFRSTRSLPFAGVIHPYGDRCPASAYEPYRRFHRRGGHICWLGGIPFRRPIVQAGNGEWRVELTADVFGLPCWLHLLCEDLGGSSWCRLIETWGLFADFPANGRTARNPGAAGAIGPLERDMRFHSLVDCELDDGTLLGATAWTAEHRGGPFKRARIGGVAAPLPSGRNGEALVAAILRSLSGRMTGRMVRPAPARRFSGRPGNLPACRIRTTRHGSPRLTIGGRIAHPAIYEFDLTHRCLRHSIPAMYESGVRIFKPCMNLFPTWTSEHQHNFDWFDDIVTRVLAAAPDGLLWPNVQLTPGPWWFDRHPEELSVVDGETVSREDAGNAGRPVLAYTLGPPTPSLGSRVWKNRLGHAIEKLVEHIAAAPYASRFIGLQLGFGHASEWIENAMVGDRWSLGDWHPAMQEEFRRYAARHPRWKSRSPHVPARHERFGSDLGTFKDPGKGDLATLWYRFMAREAARTLDGFAARVKKASGGRMLTSAFAGYFFQAGRCAYQCADSISYAVSEYAGLKHIDAFETPYGYDDRGIGGNCTFRGVPDVLAVHGKLYLSQNDQRTDRAARPEETVYGAARTPWEAVQVLKRNAGRAFTRGAGQSWYDFGLGWFDDRAYQETLRRLLKLGNRLDGTASPTLPGLGVVIDDEALFHQRNANTLLYRLLYGTCSQHLDRIGVPWYVYLLDDLLSGRVDPPHRCWLFLNTFLLSIPQRKKLRRRFCRDGNTLTWLYAPGFQGLEKLSKDGIRALTGFSVGMLPGTASGQLTLCESGDPLVRGLDIDTVAGAENLDDKGSILDPVFYIDDPDAVILGTLEAVDLPGFAVKRFKDWTSIYAATSGLNADIYRNICREAGVHIYSDTGDILYIDRRLITIVAREAGRRTIRLPWPRRAVDALTAKALGSGRQFELLLKNREARLIEIVAPPSK